MAQRSKRYTSLTKKVDSTKQYTLPDAVQLVKENATAKFDESVDIAIRLGVDPRKADQLVRGTVSLPHGIGKTVRVLVVTRDAKQAEAREAGADHVGFEDILEKIKGGWTDVDVVIATPDVMGELGKLGKILGPRGLMPNPKSGTVTMDVATAVREVKAGKIEYRVDRSGIVHASIGKASFPADKLIDNIHMFMGSVMRNKPQSSKGKYVRGITISSTMGPGVPIVEAVMTQGAEKH
ncbi:MAG TPA: 50S ribosomal protein L1 [Candidatus Kapabacteria bacterium]|nr:50S ribosomal protein L1 [Candidatus Kapabacteria bacterium]